ncbi:hypothetical protein HG536_0H04200 [Torulaspora globosa]|uniref:Zn(2)-C6 fungal-type domain-containing protein n=1 Tax=Torulaspora globosa TaxID=48254 RepID=A0A7G3ZNF8_9SACH|nr:uncharacterized protein HG536_0H04200 [Torulaspora globosa]QLL35044.1 hypothetical protein HG536_0H04200 [Torulaspora globosa]
MSEAPRAVKRRRKVVKSCTFCRKRKLKCDHGKPMCNQCLERKLPNCLYTDHFNFQLTTDELFSDSPNVELIRRINELEEKLKDFEGGAVSDGTHSSSTPSSGRSSISTGPRNNPLWAYRTFIQMDGQCIVFGPTSWRTTVVAQGDRFVAEYKKLWDMIMPERCKWMSSSWKTQKMPITPEEECATGALCKELPGYQELRKSVIKYFDDEYHVMFKVLDKEKTLNDLERCFIRSPDDQDRVIDIIAPDGDGNLCKAALILMILCLTKLEGAPPPLFSKFFTSLTALNLSTKLSFVERSQFLLLRFFNNVYYSYVCEEAPQVGGMVAELCECSMNLGLAEANTYYKGKESEVGPLYTLNNAWLWTLYADVLVAFEFGRPLLISDDHFDPETLKLYEQTEEECGGLLRRRRLMLMKFIQVSRYCIMEINSRSSSGNIDVAIEQLIAYIQDNLLPIRCYTSQETIPTVDFFDVTVLAPSLGMLLNFHNIQRTWLNSPLTTVKNGLVKFGLLSLSLSVNTILGILERDAGKDGHRALHFALLLVNPLLMRVLSEMYSAFFYKLSLFEDGLIKSIDWGTCAVELHNLDVPTSEYYSFVGAINMFREMIDELFEPSKAHLQALFFKSHAIATTLALEKVSRTLFDRARESRTKAENYCSFTDEGTISQETLNEMTDIFWSTYDQQSQDLWSMKPQDF